MHSNPFLMDHLVTRPSAEMEIRISSLSSPDPWSLSTQRTCHTGDECLPWLSLSKKTRTTNNSQMTGWREEDSAVCRKISSFLRYYLRVPRQLRNQYDITRKKYWFSRTHLPAQTVSCKYLPWNLTVVHYSGQSQGGLLLERPWFLCFSVCLFFFVFNVQDHRIWDNELHFVIFINIRIAWISYFSFLLLRRGGRDVLYIHKRYSSYKLSRAGVSLRLLTL